MIDSNKIWLTIGLMLCVMAGDAYAAGDLTVGLEPEFSLLMMLFRLMLGACAVLLLVAGCYLPRFTDGIFSFMLGLAIGFLTLAQFNFLLAFLAAIIIFAGMMWISIKLPRLFMAFAMVLPPVFIYGFWLYSSGAFGLNKALLLGLAVACFIDGALFPVMSRSIIAPVLACFLGNIAWPQEISFLVMISVLGIGIIWQLFLWFRRWLNEIESDQEPEILHQNQWASWKKSVIAGAAVSIVLLLMLAFFSPQPIPVTPEGARRIDRLRNTGALTRPGFIFSSDDGFYLFGKSYPIALVGKYNTFLNRFTAFVLGHSISRTINDMRAMKDPAEIERLKQAGAITTKAMNDVASLVRPGANEKDLEQAILESFRRNGATGLAFKCLIASGKNALLPHYRANNATLNDGFVVIDIGCMKDGYASDMTRTFPVNGSLTDAQSRLLNIVLDAKAKAVATLKPGASFREVDKVARDVIKKAGFGLFFIHSVGHHVGINVHDPQLDTLQEGMVVTIEPGIYVPEGANVDKSYWNLGIRIEDTYLITQKGSEPLTGK